VNAGRELDAVVAEKVMGFRWEEWQTGRGLYDQEGVKRGKRFHTNRLVFEEVPTMGVEAVPTRPLPHYSTDIAAAWEVVERFRVEPIGPRMVIVGCYDSAGLGNNGIGCEIKDGVGGSWQAFADTAPLAICRAALQAVGVEA